VSARSPSSSSAGTPPTLRSQSEASARLDLRRKVIDYYDENQFFYDRFWTDSSTRSMNYGYWKASTFRLAEAFRNQNAAISNALRVESSDRILEAGCGTGGATVWIAREHGSRGVGVSLSGRQARIGNRIASEKGVANRVGFLVMDYTELGFPDASFDKIFASESVCYAWRKSAFAREAFRVLKPGGRLVVIDGFRSERRLEDSERKSLSIWAEGWAVPCLATVDEFRSHLEAAGFRGVTFADQTAHIMPSARRILARGLAAWPPALAARTAGLITEGQLAHVRSSLHQYRVWRDRIALHGIFSASK
jgi:cyclopropane fatty-acyl-phospholipid synthase-like methyltransferase